MIMPSSASASCAELTGGDSFCASLEIDGISGMPDELKSICRSLLSSGLMPRPPEADSVSPFSSNTSQSSIKFVMSRMMQLGGGTIVRNTSYRSLSGNVGVPWGMLHSLVVTGMSSSMLRGRLKSYSAKYETGNTRKSCVHLPPLCKR